MAEALAQTWHVKAWGTVGGNAGLALILWRGPSSRESPWGSGSTWAGSAIPSIQSEPVPHSHWGLGWGAASPPSCRCFSLLLGLPGHLLNFRFHGIRHMHANSWYLKGQYVCLCAHVCVYGCIFVLYVYVYTYTHIYTHTHRITFIHLFVSWFCPLKR